MKKVVMVLGLVLGLAVGVPSAGAQDYRARVQGSVDDSSAAALPGATVTLRNDATGVAVTSVTDEDGRYIFDFVDPGIYTIVAELAGLQAGRAAQRPRRSSAATSPSI